MSGVKGRSGAKAGTRLGRRVYIADEWPKQCPNCRRPTYPPKRAGLEVNVDPKLHAVCADRADGTCTRCLSTARDKMTPRTRAGADAIGRPLPAKLIDQVAKPRHYNRKVMTPEEIEAARDALRGYLLDRRLRGVPVEGVAVEDWARGNGGLYASEIP